MGEEDELPTMDTKAEEEDEPKQYPITPFVAKTQDILQKTTNTTKWSENLKRKMRPQKAAKHLTMCSTTQVVK